MNELANKKIKCPICKIDVGKEHFNKHHATKSPNIEFGLLSKLGMSLILFDLVKPIIEKIENEKKNGEAK